ncbi:MULTISPECIES: envelope integrity protein Cei [unclassified Crossiella]|uniref:envelope integrity protein Cei n=1 Tax=unclassified Crossiella TaxID=2620835 RepID=UPI0027E5809D|nr:envelope integrity protein Cei [Crossiella sp. S99.1]
MRQGLGRYRRRRPLPALIILALLGVIATFVWSKVFRNVDDVEAAVRCDGPPAVEAGKTPYNGQGQARDALDKTDPWPASDVKIRVLNGGGLRGQAKLVNEELIGFGFNKAGEPGDDPVYADKLSCHGQLRYGPNGAGAARTMSLLAPCVQLVRDERQDSTVDVVLGKKFDGIKPAPSTRQLLDKLKEWAEQQPEKGGQQAAPPPPQLDAEQLASARNVHC